MDLPGDKPEFIQLLQDKPDHDCRHAGNCYLVFRGKGQFGNVGRNKTARIVLFREPGTDSQVTFCMLN